MNIDFFVENSDQLKKEYKSLEKNILIYGVIGCIFGYLLQSEGHLLGIVLGILLGSLYGLIQGLSAYVNRVIQIYSDDIEKRSYSRYEDLIVDIQTLKNKIK